MLESLYKMRIRESDQLKTVLELYEMEIHQKMSKYQKLKTMAKRCIDQKRRLSSFDARNERIETGAVVVLKEDKENAINGKQKNSVCDETDVVSDTMERNGNHRLQNPLHPPFHQHKEVEVRREKGASEAGVPLGRPIDSHLH